MLFIKRTIMEMYQMLGYASNVYLWLCSLVICENLCHLAIILFMIRWPYIKAKQPLSYLSKK